MFAWPQRFAVSLVLVLAVVMMAVIREGREMSLAVIFFGGILLAYFLAEAIDGDGVAVVLASVGALLVALGFSAW